MDVQFGYTGSGYSGRVITSQVFRDPAAWYHIVVAVDTTQAVAANRCFIYVNGVSVPYTTSVTITQNFSTQFNNTAVHNIGRIVPDGFGGAAWQYFDGYMSNINWIDGQQLTANSFGSFNQYGVWQPINYGGSYGTNGFYLPFNSGSETYAAQFNGSSQYLSTTATSFNASTGTWTVEGWAYLTNSGGNDILLLGQVSGTDRFYLAYGGTTLYLGDVATNNVVATNAKPLNQWFHWAAVKNGSTYTVYINGVSVGSSTTALGSYSLTTWLIGARPSQPGYLTGYMSNVRVNTTTAVYTSNFVPSTTPLTAISGTQLLTLQNATFVDNSTNNYTITNNGSMANPATGKPLSTAVFRDQSPQGNNWTPNNISGATGSTLDYMTDVPTLTSATAANYPVLNPLLVSWWAGPGVGTITNGNLRLTGTGKMAFNSMALPINNKTYFEVYVTTMNNAGIDSDSVTLSAQARATYEVSYLAGGYKLVNGTKTAYGATWTSGDTIGVAYDPANNQVTFYKNNVSQGAITNTVPAQTILAGYYIEATNSGDVSFNFGQQPFKYTPPSGYIALNAYNM